MNEMIELKIRISDSLPKIPELIEIVEMSRDFETETEKSMLLDLRQAIQEIDAKHQEIRANQAEKKKSNSWSPLQKTE